MAGSIATTNINRLFSEDAGTATKGDASVVNNGTVRAMPRCRSNVYLLWIPRVTKQHLSRSHVEAIRAAICKLYSDSTILTSVCTSEKGMYWR